MQQDNIVLQNILHIPKMINISLEIQILVGLMNSFLQQIIYIVSNREVHSRNVNIWTNEVK